MSDTETYTPPQVWIWDKDSGGKFANINRPVAGASHEKDLPVGKHPLQLYSLATPNGVKVTVLLEELLALGKSDAEYDAWLINIGEGDQFGSGFVAVNPNSKIPALLDTSTSPPIRVFESGAIMVYLAEKFGAFLPTEPAARAEEGEVPGQFTLTSESLTGDQLRGKFTGLIEKGGLDRESLLAQIREQVTSLGLRGS